MTYENKKYYSLILTNPFPNNTTADNLHLCLWVARGYCDYGGIWCSGTGRVSDDYRESRPRSPHRQLHGLNRWTVGILYDNCVHI